MDVGQATYQDAPVRIELHSCIEGMPVVIATIIAYLCVCSSMLLMCIIIRSQVDKLHIYVEICTLRPHFIFVYLKLELYAFIYGICRL